MIKKITLTFCFLLLLVAWIGFPDIIQCPYKAHTNEPCVFCGTLTSLSLTTHGRINDAWAINPTGLAVFLLSVFFLFIGVSYSIGKYTAKQY